MLKLLKQNPLSSLMMIVSIVSLSLPVFAAPLPGAFIGSTITVGDTANTYAIADVNYLQGGLHSYATLTERNAITTERRHWGMFAVVYNDSGNNGVYQLTYNNVDTNINNNANWTLFSAGGGGGGTLTLRTNGTDNGSQTLLNLVAGSNITLTDNGSGAITIAASGGGGGGSSPITVENGTSLFSTGLTGTGTASTATNAIFLGENAGNSVAFGDNSIFLGANAGSGAVFAKNSIFLGENAGNNDSVDNESANTWSVLIGRNTGTGGFTNSILLGGSELSFVPIFNTKANQFMLADTITDVRWRGVEYELPSAQAASTGYILSNDGTGVLSWVPGGAGTVTSVDVSGAGPISFSGGPITTTGSIALSFTGSSSDVILADGSTAPYSGGGSITLQTDGTPNGSQTLLNLVGGSNVTLTDDGSGTVTIDASGGGGADDTIYNADGLVGGPRTVSFISALHFLDTGTGKTGIFFDTPNTQTIIGDTGMTGSAYLNVDNTNNRVEINGGNLYIPTGASNGYVLTSDGSGNATWQVAGAGTGIDLQTDGTPNGSQTLLNLVGGTNVTLTDNGTGTVTIDASGGGGSGTVTSINVAGSGGLSFTGGPVTSSGTITAAWGGTTAQYVRGDGTLATFTTSGLGLETDGTPNGDQSLLNLIAGADISLTDDGVGGITIASTFVPSITVQNTSSLFSTGLIGSGTSSSATNALFFGVNAGNAATTANNSVFLGLNSGSGATNASNAIFIGRGAGLNDTANNTAAFDDSATFASTSILIGHNTSTGGFENSLAFGAYAQNSASNQLVIGSTTRPIYSILIGGNKGTAAPFNSAFIGNGAGFNATGAAAANFIGFEAGHGATNTLDSNFFGAYAGKSAINATQSTFIGKEAGINATNAAASFFIGTEAGDSATNAAFSIFIGDGSGTSDTVNNTASFNDTTTFSNTSILIGRRTSTGGFSNSIAIGAYATNTATNEFMIGSTQRPINTTRINGASSTQCTITTGTGIACTSDERLKTNIEDLSSSTLDTLLNVKTVTYNWLENPDSPQQVGFLAQDLEQYFPQLVATDSDGYKSVYYAQMTPILVEAIREINTRITSLSDIDTDNSWRDSLTDWFASAQNGIGKLFAKEIRTEMLCVKKSDGTEVCINGDQLERALNGQGMTIVVPQTPDPVEETQNEEQVPEVTDETESVPEGEPEPIPDTEPEQQSEPAPAEVTPQEAPVEPTP